MKPQQWATPAHFTHTHFLLPAFRLRHISTYRYKHTTRTTVVLRGWKHLILSGLDRGVLQVLHEPLAVSTLVRCAFAFLLPFQESPFVPERLLLLVDRLDRSQTEKQYQVGINLS